MTPKHILDTCRTRSLSKDERVWWTKLHGSRDTFNLRSLSLKAKRSYIQIFILTYIRLYNYIPNESLILCLVRDRMKTRSTVMFVYRMNHRAALPGPSVITPNSLELCSLYMLLSVKYARGRQVQRLSNINL